MARDFNGSTDRIDYANVDNLVGQNFTFHAKVYLDDANGGSQYLIHAHPSGDATFNAVLWVPAASFDGCLQWSHDGSTTLIRRSNNNVVSNGQWYDVVVTGDGSTTAANYHIYLNGSEVSYQTTTNGASLLATTGSWSLGGRIFDDNRNFNGRMTGVCYWTAILDASEITALNNDYSPLHIRPANRLWYLPLVRNANDIYGKTASLDGTTVIQHPRIITPSPKMISYAAAAPPPAGRIMSSLVNHGGLAAAGGLAGRGGGLAG